MEGGVSELVVKRNKALIDTQPCFTIPGLDALEKEYRTKDLFEPHPNIADLWRWRSRADDIIVFLNGEKTNPISMEQHIMASNPELSGALVIGAQRFQAALLIEPASESPLSTAEQAALIERIWPSVDQANRTAPAHARVEKAFILVVPADRRLIRAGKGTFIRTVSISQYTEEIEKLYSKADVVAGDEGDDEATAVVTGPEGVARVVRQQVRAVTGWNSMSDDDVSFFDHGMDSLQGLQLTRALRRSLRRPEIALSTIYQNPTVSLLVTAILTGANNEADGLKTMEDLLAVYRGLIDQIPVPTNLGERPQGGASKPVNVLLTGSTGTVGTQLLRALLDRRGIGRIFCLNRRDDGGKRTQISRSFMAGLPITDLDNNQKVTFLKAELHQPRLGLDAATYEMLQSEVSLIIHNAWPVNFNMSLSAFRPQFAGLVNLLALSASSCTARFVFISSVAAVEGYNKPGPPPEEIIDDLKVAAPIGYGRAKLLSELLVDHAARKLDHHISTTVIRVGQVAGTVRRPGLWKKDEWFPSMVLSSLFLCRIPDNLGPMFNNVDFVPVDLLADVLVDLAITTTNKRVATTTTATATTATATTVFNVRNPKIVSWKTLLPAVTAAAIEPLQIVSPATWLANLRTSPSDEQMWEGRMDDDEDTRVGNPALKLLDFFEELWRPPTAAAAANDEKAAAHQQNMAVDRALAASPSLRKIGPVSLEWMRKWAREWVALSCM